MMTTVEAVHLQLAEKAAELANVWAIEAGLVEAGHPPFYPVKRSGRAISLGIEEAIAEGRDEQWYEAIHQVAYDAAHTAIESHADLVVGLVLGCARKGINYFEEYAL